MSDWDPEKYLQFQAQRTQPAIDLAARVSGVQPRRVIDIGCGPGNSTAVLRTAFPKADILGIDTSASMLRTAEANHPDIAFALCDAWDMEGGYDLIFSNACLQWIPDHARLLPHLMSRLNEGGVLAVQMPINGDEPLFRLIHEVTHEAAWGFDNSLFEINRVLSPEAYHDILAACTARFDMWETVYHHRMPSHRALIEWVRPTRLRPFLEVLDEESEACFEAELLARVQRVYPALSGGDVLLRFRRLFFLGRK